MIPKTTSPTPLVTASAGGTTATLRWLGGRRFRLHLSYDHAPGFVRVFLAFSLRHLAVLLVNHVPAGGVQVIADAVARAGVA
jgi:hypothetical protein